jgi:ankyrin repeat protein
MTPDRREIYRRHKAAHAAYCAGNVKALREALNDPPDFPNCRQPLEWAVGDHPLEYAIYWSPLAFIAHLIGLGADVNYDDPAGFPSLIAALSSGRPERGEIVKLLLDSGADVAQRGVNDWTPLHYAVVERDAAAVRMLLAHGADPTLRTRIDDCSSPLEDAKAAGFTEAAELMREALSARRRR